MFTSILHIQHLAKWLKLIEVYCLIYLGPWEILSKSSWLQQIKWFSLLINECIYFTLADLDLSRGSYITHFNIDFTLDAIKMACMGFSKDHTPQEDMPLKARSFSLFVLLLQRFCKNMTFIYPQPPLYSYNFISILVTGWKNVVLGFILLGL